MKEKTFLAFVFFLNFGIFSEEPKIQELSEEDKIRQEIKNLMLQIEEKAEKSRRLYEEMSISAQALRKEAEAKIESVETSLRRARENSLINRTLLEKAIELSQKARLKFNQKNYKEAIDLANEAFANITEVPLVQLILENRLFSPNGDGENDELNFQIKVKSQHEIEKWQLQIWRSEPNDEDILVFEVQGKELPQNFMWDGKRDGKLVVDSATNYFAQLTVTDKAQGIGSSGRIYFKTDIFAHRTERGLLIDITNIRFEPDKAVLLPENFPILEQLFQVLLKYPQYKIIVEGHAHFSGPANWSKTLSDQRAEAVAKHLISLGLEKERLIVQGMGESLPRTYLPEEAPLNRRVSFLLIRNKEELEAYRKFVKSINFKKEVIPPKNK